MSEKDEAETGQPTDLGGLGRLIRSAKSEGLTAELGAATEATDGTSLGEQKATQGGS
jgi:hypothetical protein